MPVAGAVGYEVSDLGRVRSLDRVVMVAGKQRAYKGRVLKPQANGKYGYLSVQIGRDRRDYIHRLVAEAFIGLARGEEVDHIDGDTANNQLNNLRAVTHAQNMIVQRERKTECSKGHSFEDAYWGPNGRRQCRTCRREADRRRRPSRSHVKAALGELPVAMRLDDFAVLIGPVVAS